MIWDELYAKPMAILMAVFGSLVTQLLPGWVVSLLLGFVLCILVLNLTRKALALHRREYESLTRRPSAVSINSVNSAKVGLFMGEDAESGVVHRSRVNSVYIEQSSRGDVDVGIVSPVDDKRSVNGSRSPNIESSAQMSFSNIEGKKEQPSLVNMPPTTSVSLPKPPPIGEPKFQITNKVIHNEVMETHSDELEKILREEMQLPPWSKVRGLFAVFLTVLAFLALSFATRCGTSGFWLLIIVNALILVFSSIYNRATLLLQHQRKKKARYTFAIGDIRWTGRSTLFNTILNGFAGFFSGFAYRDWQFIDDEYPDL